MFLPICQSPLSVVVILKKSESASNINGRLHELLYPAWTKISGGKKFVNSEPVFAQLNKFCLRQRVYGSPVAKGGFQALPGTMSCRLGPPIMTHNET